MSDEAITRRQFAKLGVVAGAATGAAACGDAGPPGDPECTGEALPLPPPGARVVPTACDYCVVGCGYQAVAWPVDGPQGTPADNALGLEVPSRRGWPTLNMYTRVEIDGAPHHVLVVPDRSEFVNRDGNHSVRGGTLALKLYREDRPTRDRLRTPLLRVDDAYVPISWDEALELVARLSRHAIDRHGEASWAMKMFSYQYYENTYALTKLALGAVGTPAWAVHDKPADVPDTPGLSDAGFDAFNASYQDWREAETIFVSGAALNDTKTVLFQDWMTGYGKLIVVNPRRDVTAAYAERYGGMHLAVEPGTDTLLHNAIARVILEQGWQDDAFIAARTASDAELAMETSHRRRRHGMTFAQYRDFILGEDAHRPEQAAAITRVPAEQIREAARRMAEPRAGGRRPKTSLTLEKGNYWAHNYDNTASLASLALLVGAGSGPGRVLARAGGHQRGMLMAAPYPLDKSPDMADGARVALNVDRWAAEGRVRLAWVVGTTWFAAMAASQSLRARVERQLAVAPLRQSDLGTDPAARAEAAFRRLRARMDMGGLVLVAQEIYPTPLTALADIVLPAAAWGEADFTRMQGERRLRIYSKIVDPPGEARPDWWIAAQVAQRMGFEGFAWPDANAVFEEAAARSEDTPHAYAGLVALAHQRGMTGHEYLRSLGTRGVQCPVTLEGRALRETVRLHDERFGTRTGKAVFPRGDWAGRVAHAQEQLRPRGDELWITNIRLNRLWQSMHDDARIPFRSAPFPGNLLELSPADAAARGIEAGDWVEVRSRIRDYSGDEIDASFRALAVIVEDARPGLAAAYFNYRGDVGQAPNAITSTATDPINPLYRLKLGRGQVVRVGPSEHRDQLRRRRRAQV